MKIKDICNSVTDGSHNPPQGIENSEYMMLSSKNVFDDEVTFDEPRYLSEDDFEKENKRTNISHGDVLLTIVGTVGRTAVVSENMPKFTLQRSVAVLHPKKNICSGRFLMYALRGKRSYIEGSTKSVAQKGIYLGEVSEIDIEVPNAEQQQAIIEKLDKIYEIIRLRREELNSLDDLIKARFVELFGNKGENPNNYEEVKLGNLYKFQYGKGNNIPEDKGEFPCYGSNGIVGHHTEYNNEDAPIIGHIGAYAGIVNWGAGKHYVTYNGVMCKLKSNRINPIYGFHLLQHQDFNRVATKGGGQPFVSYGDLEAPTVVVPPMDVQEAYADFVKQVDKSKVVVQKALDQAQRLFGSLMQEYFG